MGYEPKTFEEFVGQEEIKRELLAMLVSKSKQCILLRGNYGSGKTTLAKIMSSCRGDFTYQDVPDIMNPSNEGRNTHIIDEIHMASKYELLYKNMGEIMYIFCTTEREKLPAPFLSRCIELVMRDYNDAELSLIVQQKARKDGIAISDGAITIIAERSRNTPRTATVLLTRLNNLANLDRSSLTPEYVERTLDTLRVYSNGLIEDDVNYLRLLDSANYSPVSLNTISAVLNRHADYIRDDVEYFLLYKRYILITPRGRVLTASGEYLVREMEGK